MSKVPQIGDAGPGGGQIFITPSTEGNSTSMYFEAAPWRTKANWGVRGKILGASGTSIGTGVTNTAAMYTNGACKIASEYSNNGFSDWFLPSKDELNEMYKNRKSLGKHRRGVYWSSSEIDANFAWNLDFNFGGQYNNIKSGANYVRPVRAFN